MAEKLIVNKYKVNVDGFVKSCKQDGEKVVKVYCVKENQDSVRQAVSSKVEKALIKLFDSRSNSYEMPDTIDFLEKALFIPQSKKYTVMVLYFDKYTVFELEYNSESYKEQVEYWRLIEENKPKYPISGTVKELYERPRKDRIVSRVEEEVELVDF